MAVKKFGRLDLITNVSKLDSEVGSPRSLPAAQSQLPTGMKNQEHIQLARAVPKVRFRSSDPGLMTA
jgi:hypothetical protein